jgi:molybdopterin-guanine dinucleotide biosynthesis protein A
MDSPKTISDMTASVSAVILAGGNSSRMKSNKALLPYRGELFIERINRQMSAIFRDVILVTNTPDLYRFLPCSAMPDIFPGMGSLAGIHAGLSNSKTPYIFAVACDMPHLNEVLIRHLIAKINGQDVVIPESESRLEPLHAIYGKGALTVMEEALSRGNRKIVSCCSRLMTTVIAREEVRKIDPVFLSFRNINTPEDYFLFRDEDNTQEKERYFR